MNQSTTKSVRISGNLRIAALGATVAILPAALVILLDVLGISKGMPPFDTLATIQFIGCLVWAGCLGACIPVSKRMDIPALGLGLCIAGVSIGGILQLVVVHDEESIAYMFRDMYFGRSLSAMNSIILYACLANVPLAVGSFLLGKNLPAMKNAIFAYAALALFPLILSMLKGKGGTILILLFVLLLICIIIALMSWWGTVGQAKYLEESGNETDGAEVQYDEPIQPAITDEQKSMIAGMSDQELAGVVNNPALYAAAFVDEARKVLSIRQALASLKDMTDEQMLEAVHNNPQGFSYEVLDAISMELLKRETPAFINEIESLPTPELQAMVYNADAYYDGYAKLATRVLHNRLNPAAPKQA